jgi:aryl-alcohol dehydrogenase
VPTQTTAAVVRAVRGPFTLEQLELSDPRDTELLVRVVATGICHTDLSMRDKLYPVPHPLVMGHEGAGVVERVGAAVTKVAPGDHVVMSYNSCGTCPSCLEHRESYCHDFFGRNFGGTRPDGSVTLSSPDGEMHGNFFGQSSFATLALCHERNVVRVPDDVPLELLGPLACGVQTGAGAVIHSLEVRPGTTIAVFGAGSVGLSAVMAAKVCAATTIISVDLNPARLALAQELGATHTIDAGSVDAVAAIMEITGAGVDRSLEAVGTATTIRQAVDCLAPRGICGLVGASTPDAEVSLNIVHQMTGGRVLRGIVEGDSTPERFIPQLIELYRRGMFPFDRLVTFYDFADINAAIADAEAGDVIKPVLRMGGAT